MKNALSIDLEDWYHRPILWKYLENNSEKTCLVAKSVQKILRLLENYKKSATFFVLGEIAERLPDLIELIVAEGHEVGCHGFSHTPLTHLNKKKFLLEMTRATSILKNITGNAPRGFRAALYSLNKETKWALDVLDALKYKYDSSIYPAWTPLSQAYKAPVFPYKPSMEDPGRTGRPSRNLVEFPLLVRNFPLIRIPAAGGFYLRLLGPHFIKKCIRAQNKKGYPAMCYIHPWEVYPFPKIKLPLHKTLFVYYRIPCFSLFRNIVKSINFTSGIDALESYGFL